MFLLLKYQKLLIFLVKNPKKKVVTFFSVLSYGITHKESVIELITKVFVEQPLALTLSGSAKNTCFFLGSFEQTYFTKSKTLT